MKVLELFSGTKSFSKVFKETFTVDNNPELKPDLVKDILELKPSDIPFKPDIIWSSPPCTTFSVAGDKSNYTNFTPNNLKACLGLAYVFKCIEIIQELKPKYWFIENPMGYLRKFPFMQNFHKVTVCYCKYGDKRRKPTDIWTNLISWIPKDKCKNGDKCHEQAPRGSRTGTQGLKNAELRGEIPKELCLEIKKYCEGKAKFKQNTLK